MKQVFWQVCTVVLYRFTDVAVSDSRFQSRHVR